MFQEKEKISLHQGFMLLLAGGIGNIFLVLAAPAIKDAGRDGWIPVLLAYALATLIGLVVIDLSKRFPGKSFVQYAPLVLGKFFGKALGLFYILSFWAMTPLIIRQMVELMRLFLSNTPPLAINLLLSGLIVYTMHKGFEVFARTTEVFSVFLLGILLLVLIIASTGIDFRYVTPILANGWVPILSALPTQVPYALETVIFMSLWLPCLAQPKGIKKSLVLSMSLSGLILAFIVIVVLGFMGPVLPANQIFPMIRIFRFIHIFDFITGLDIFYIWVWTIAIYLEMMVFFYQPVVGLAQWLHLKDYKPLILPMAMLNLSLALIPRNVIQVLSLDILKNPTLILPIGIAIFLVWLVALIRKSKNKEYG
jgi:spore germination protein KB